MLPQNIGQKKQFRQRPKIEWPTNFWSKGDHFTPIRRSRRSDQTIPQNHTQCCHQPFDHEDSGKIS